MDVILNKAQNSIRAPGAQSTGPTYYNFKVTWQNGENGTRKGLKQTEEEGERLWHCTG